MATTMEIKAAGRVEGVDVSESMILVGSSQLSGNNWDGSLQVFSTTAELLASIQRPSGCADVCWTKLGQRAVCAEDSGDVKVGDEDIDRCDYISQKTAAKGASLCMDGQHPSSVKISRRIVRPRGCRSGSRSLRAVYYQVAEVWFRKSKCADGAIVNKRDRNLKHFAF